MSEPGAYTPEEMAAQYEQPSGLEARVAALEAQLEDLAHPRISFAMPEFCEEDAARFREELEAAMKKPQLLRVATPVHMLSPEQVRLLLRECVTVVKPGETLVLRGRDWTPNQVHEIQQVMDAMHEDGTIPFKVLAVFGDELGVIQAEEEPAA